MLNVMTLFDVFCAEPPPWYQSPEWWLFIIGVPTLIFIGVQAVASKKAAKAALLNAQALINSERAWVDIDIVYVDPKESLTSYWMRAINYGKSPAFITEIVLGRAYWLDKIGDIPQGFDGTVTPDKYPMLNPIPPGSVPVELVDFDVAAFSHGEDGRKVTYHGHVTYQDIFGQEHRTEITYLLGWWVNGGGAHSSLTHLSEYTRYLTTKKATQNPN
jgi:hypothetical protein